MSSAPTRPQRTTVTSTRTVPSPQQPKVARPVTTSGGQLASAPAIAKLLAAEQVTKTKIFGREQPIRGITLAVVARLNVLLLGVPGTAKTEMVELLTSSFCQQADFYSTMLTKFSKPAEVFGPLDMNELQRSNYRHDTVSFLPTAVVGVLDEVFKGSSAILNSLLTIANERRFKNGRVWEQCPTRLIVGMSNEYPDDPAMLAAFFDRLPIKFKVEYLPTDTFRDMLSRPDSKVSVSPLTDADFAAIDADMQQVVVPQEIIDTLCQVRELLAAKKVVASDRRWMQCVRLLKAAAVLVGRLEVQRQDVRVLSTVLWNNDDEIKTVADIIEANADPFGRSIREITAEAYAERKAIVQAAQAGRAAGSAPDMVKVSEAAARTVTRLKAIKAKLFALQSEAKTQGDREQLTFAEASVQSVSDAVNAVAMGQADLSVLLDTVNSDVQ